MYYFSCLQLLSTQCLFWIYYTDSFSVWEFPSVLSCCWRMSFFCFSASNSQAHFSILLTYLQTAHPGSSDHPTVILFPPVVDQVASSEFAPRKTLLNRLLCCWYLNVFSVELVCQILLFPERLVSRYTWLYVSGELCDLLLLWEMCSCAFWSWTINASNYLIRASFSVLLKMREICCPVQP